MVRDTVAACTPARAATSRIVARCSRRTTRDPTRRPRHREAGDEPADAAAAERAARWPRHTHGHSPTTTAPRCPSSPTSDSGPSPGRTSPCTPTICLRRGPPGADQRRLHQEPTGAGPTRAPGRALHRGRARARRRHGAAGGRRARLHGDGPAAAVEADGRPATKLVTLTITEKGYDARGGPSCEARDRPRRRSSPWRWPGAAGPGWHPPSSPRSTTCSTTARVLRARVLDAAERMDAVPRRLDRARRSPSPARWSTAWCPPRREDDLEDIADALGLVDRAAVSTERHRSWIIQSVDGAGPPGRRRRGARRRRRPLRAAQALAPQRPALRRGLLRPAGRACHHRRAP